jgi:NAD(P)-dependent dehydrogenase (short-subunit alcohol dehydrogenase family)
MTAIEGATALVTGGSRGIGKALVEELLARGAKKVYATARDPRTVTTAGAVPLALEVSDSTSIAALAEQAPDVTILINNAGVSLNSSLLDAPDEQIRREFEINFFGPLDIVRAFVPIIESNGGGNILNVHSALSWVSFPSTGAYSATKSALWSATNWLRFELQPRGINVTGLHVGYVDTDLTSHLDVPKVSPQSVARQAIDAIAANAYEVLADDATRKLKSALSGDLTAIYPQLVAKP